MNHLAIRVLRCLAVCALLVAAAEPLHAGVIIYDNFGPGDSYATMSSWALSATVPDLAEPFTPMGGSFQLDSITLPLTAIDLRFPNQIDVWLMSDAGGVPNAIIEAFHFSNAMPPGDLQYHPPLVASSILHPLLEAGTRYWIAASVAQYATTPGVYVGWQWNVTGDTGPSAYRYADKDQWSVNPGGMPRGAFRVEAVPEPTTSGLVMAAFLGLALYRSRVAGAKRENRDGETRCSSQPQTLEGLPCRGSL